MGPTTVPSMTSGVETTGGHSLAVEEGVAPTLPMLIGLFVAHVVIWIGLIAVIPGSDRVSFEFLGDESTPFVRQFVIPLLAVVAFQTLVVRKLGWWSSVMRDSATTDKTWLWAPIGLFIVIAIAGTFATDGWTDAGTSYVIGLAATVILVGVTEEFTFRGLLLVGARRIFSREWHAAIFAAALFGLFHLPNALLGNPLSDEIPHVVQTAMLGLVFYALRRLSGTILVPMAIHAVWDFAVLQANWDVIASAHR